MKRYRLLVCRGPECGETCNSAEIHAAFVAGIRRAGLEGVVELGWQSCFGRCRYTPWRLRRPIAGESDCAPPFERQASLMPRSMRPLALYWFGVNRTGYREECGVDSRPRARSG